MIYRYSWGPRFRVPGMPVLDRKGQLCRVIARGAMNSALIEFEDGEQHVVSRNALRRAIGTMERNEWAEPVVGQFEIDPLVVYFQ